MKRIVCCDALPWLDIAPHCAIVTSPPLTLELGCTVAEWSAWYLDALARCFRALAPGAPAVIYSTDQKNDGRLISSFAVMMAAAAEAGVGLLWHKIVLRRDVGKIDIHRPGFTHLAAFGDAKAKPGAATPDAMQRGRVLYPNGMGLIPARIACEFAGRPGLPIVDPFCGRGTVPAVAEALGFDAIGIDIDPAQCKAAEALRLTRRSEDS